jgi:hypothetical protein
LQTQSNAMICKVTIVTVTAWSTPGEVTGVPFLSGSFSYAWQAPEMALRRVGSEIWRKGNVGRIGILNFVCSEQVCWFGILFV